MKLIKFKVTDFRSVVDSGWVEAERVTALIGVNESGKTNLLLPLWKLNPAREGEIKPTSDYPKGNYAAVRANPGNFKFITAQFDISAHADKLASLAAMSREALDVVEVSRFFDGHYQISFPKHEPRTEAGSDEIGKIINDAKVEISAISPLQKEASLKPDMLEALGRVAEEVNSREKWSPDRVATLAAQIRAVLPETPAATSSIVPRLQQLLDALKAKEAELTAPGPADVEAVQEFVRSKLPRFVFYSNYGNLDSEIYLPHVVQNLKREDLGAREAAKARTLRVLFSFVTLQPEEILELGREVARFVCTGSTA